MIKRDNVVILSQVIQVFQEQAKPDVLFMWIVRGRLIVFDDAVVAKDRRLSSIEPREQTNHTSSFQKGKEKPFHTKPVFPNGLSRRCPTALQDGIYHSTPAREPVKLDIGFGQGGKTTTIDRRTQRFRSKNKAPYSCQYGARPHQSRD